MKLRLAPLGLPSIVTIMVIMTDTVLENNVMPAALRTAMLACYAAVIPNFIFLILTQFVCKYTNIYHYTALKWYIACKDNTYQPLYSWLNMQEYFIIKI